jgi:hypothetical protein
MRCDNLSDDQLWRAIAQNTEKLSALVQQQGELEEAESTTLHPRARGDLIRFAGRVCEYRYADELRRRHPLD